MSLIGLLRREGTPKVVFDKPGNVRRRVTVFLSVLKVVMKKKKWINISYRNAEKRGDTKCLLW
jgi:hypothetical protein